MVFMMKKNALNNKGLRVKCGCGYAWAYTGGLSQATCPNCGKKATTNVKGGKAQK